MELGPASDGVRKNVLLVGMETGMFVLQAVVASFFLLLLFQARAPHTCLSSRYFVEHVEFCSAETRARHTCLSSGYFVEHVEFAQQRPGHLTHACPVDIL